MTEKKRLIETTNPYSGQSAMLTASEYLLYDLIKRQEEMGEYEGMQKNLTKFAKMNPDAYMTLLD